MSIAKRAPSSGSGYALQQKKQRMLEVDAEKADSYLVEEQPGRVPLDCIKWHPMNRGGRIMPMHVHMVAEEIVTNGTSLRRYSPVKLVEVPEDEEKNWLKLIKHKTSLNTLLPTMARFSPTGPYYATLDHSHFCAAQQLIAEGGRRLYDRDDGIRLELSDKDDEGQAIQKVGVVAIVYSKELWKDRAALLAIMREDSLNATIAKGDGLPPRRDRHVVGPALVTQFGNPVDDQMQLG